MGVGILYVVEPDFRAAVNTCLQEIAAYIPIATAAAAGGWRGIVALFGRLR